MELKLSLPCEERNPSIEAYKLALQHLEEAITKRCTQNHGSDSEDTNSLCSCCAVVGQRLEDIFEGPDVGDGEIDIDGSSRDASGNLYLGTLHDIFGRLDCPLCCLIMRQFLQTKRREIFTYARSNERELDGLTPIKLLGLAYSEESPVNENDCIIDPFSQSIQLSLSSLHSDGVLLIWWPENIINEVNDEPAQLPMIAIDHEAIFPGVTPWIPLPLGLIGSERNLSMFSECFNTCQQNHSKCQERMTGLGAGFGPSRLIDIEQMRIVHMGIDETPIYFILSYVWGRPPFLLLQKDNEHEFSKPGSLSNKAIPQTIFDSIEITRRFCVRYLWVDALCIVQDDPENKMHEIDRMHIIYAQAEMTIVAATGDGANSGLLDIDPAFATVGAHSISGNRFTVDPMEMRDVVEFSTWFTRGWTFQELVFSKKSLYFTPERTYYACEEGSWSEDFPFFENNNANENEHEFYDESLQTDFDFQEKLNPFQNYSSMVSKMSTRRFTKESDCLNACRGFYTGLLLKGLGGSVCGLPAIWFEFALAWQPDGNLSRRQIEQDSAYIQFPSWSWAGWNGAIDYPFLSSPDRCGIICDVTWAVFEAYTTSTAGHNSKEEFHFKQVVPTIKVHTSPEQSYQSLSSWLSHSYFFENQDHQMGSGIPVTAFDIETETTSHKILSSNFVGPSILLFQTNSIVCQIKESSRPPLVRHKYLKFFSILHKNTMIGELKVDSNTLKAFHITEAPVTPSPTTVELISIFRIDFSTEAAENLIWMNSNSSRCTFSKEFTGMMVKRSDKRMRAVMWITWDKGIASRVAVGYVTVEGYEAAGPVKKEIVLA